MYYKIEEAIKWILSIFYGSEKCSKFAIYQREVR